MDRILKFASVAALVFCTTTETAAAGDAGHGKELFAQKCSICHSADKGGPNKIGPSLFGIAGRHSASVPGFNYSAEMRAANLTWDETSLAKYLAGPQKMLPGIRMTFAGFSNPSDAADVAAFLSAQK